jgi:hypothetical protein
MSRVREFTAKIHSGTVGNLIKVEGEINCGFLEVQPELIEKTPIGINPTILDLVAFPAVDARDGSFRKAQFTKNLHGKSQYHEVEVFDHQGERLLRIPVTHSEEV